MTTPAEGAAAGREMKPFLDHLEDLRRTLIACIGVLAIGFLVAVPLAPAILGLLKRPLRIVSENPDQFLRSLEVGGAFAVSMKLAFWCGFLFSAPFLLLFAGRFVFPGLKEIEKRVVLQVAGFGIALFALGVYLGWKFTLPAALAMMFGLHGWLGIRAEWTVTSYVSFAVQLLIGFGFVFELPAVLIVLGKMGLVPSARLRHFRRHAIVAALVIGMVLTPPDVFSQLLMALPLIALYELSIWIVWAGERGGKGTLNQSQRLGSGQASNVQH